MQSKRILFTLFLFACATLFSSQSVSAANQDLSILCQDNGTCKQLGTQNIPIFSEQNIVPGQSFSRKVTVKNDNKLHSCQLHLRLTETAGAVENMLADKLLVQVFHKSTLLLGTPATGPASLSIGKLQMETFARYFWTLPPKASEEFDLTITFDPQADNQYQGKAAQRDIAVAITCLQDDELSPILETAVVLPNPKKKEVIEIPLEGCKAEISQEKPQLSVSNIDVKRGAVSLSWTPIAGAREYLLEFGTAENSEQFRHRGISATSYTVLDLDMRYDLFFRILAVADCARGQYSNVLQVPGSEGKKTELSPEPLVAQVLGSQERVIEPVSAPVAVSPGYTSEVLLAPLLVVVVLLVLCWLILRRKKFPKQ
ncbi:MAG: hypothetical protein O2840_03505 [bacterium]|nr:hypothetical protein [bacterium]